MTMAKRVKKPEFLEIDGLDRKLSIIEVCPDRQMILWRKPYSNLFGDNFLERVLAWWEGKFVVWYWNHQTGGFCDGHYFEVWQYEGSERPELDAFLDALKYFDSVGPKTDIYRRLEAYINPQTGNKEVA